MYAGIKNQTGVEEMHQARIQVKCTQAQFLEFTKQSSSPNVITYQFGD